MGVPTLVSIEEYLSGAVNETQDWECGAEFVDGVVEERFGGERDHSSWLSVLLCWFDQHRVAWNVRVSLPARLQVSPTRVRIPDVTIWSREFSRQQMRQLPPIGVFEVLSPEDRMDKLLVKLQDYSKLGIGTIRVIDPVGNVIYRYLGGVLEPVTERAEPIPGCAGVLDWTAIRAMLED